VAPELLFVLCTSCAPAGSVRPLGTPGGKNPFRQAGPPGSAKHPQFGEALKIGKSEADDRVERSLYQRAVGYTYPAVKIFMPAGAKAPIYAPYEEHVPPDVTAGIFWSKNRRPDKWRDTWHLEAAVGKYLISDKPMSPDQWIRERALLVDAEAVDVTPKEE
jgi:hypothetical protein